MRCRDIMRTDVRHLIAEDSIRTAAEVMRDAGVGFLPVVDSASSVIGVITDRDLVVRALADGRSPETAVSVVMTDEVVACMPDDDIRVAAARLARMKRSRVVVVDERGTLAGVISLSDVVEALGGIAAIASARDARGQDLDRRSRDRISRTSVV